MNRTALRTETRRTAPRCLGLLLGLLLAGQPLLARAQDKPAGLYEGRWEIQPNGDVKVTRTYTLPMQLYQMWKKADVHMLQLRSLASERSSIEVSDKTANWDDMNRKLVISMTCLGMAQNKGARWEGKLAPEDEFSNLDESKKIAYFHFSMESSMGRVSGKDEVIFPKEARELKVDPASRTISWVLSDDAIPGGSRSLAGVWWALFGVCLALGGGLWAGSFFVKS